MLRTCGQWNTSRTALPPSGHICVPLDMTTVEALQIPTEGSYSGTICACATDYCNNMEMVLGTAVDITTQASADITTQGSADITIQGSANVTTWPPAGTTKGAEGGADQTVMSLYLLCVTGLAIFY